MNKLAIVSFYTNDFLSIGELVDTNKRNYALQHHYDYKSTCVKKEDLERPPAWYKLKEIEKYLAQYEWIFWSDVDSVIINSNIKLESYLDLSYDIIIAQDANGINTGEFFIKNSEWSKTFLQRIWNEAKDINHPWWEQKSMMDLLPQPNIKIVTDRSFNDYKINKSTFIIHYAGLKNKQELLKRLVENLKLNSMQLETRLELPSLFNILNYHLGVEIGTQRGDFSNTIISNWNGTICLVDCWKHLANYDDVANVSNKQHMENYNYVSTRFDSNSNVHIYRLTSEEALDIVGTVDWVYLDANHSYESVYRDIENWYKKLKPGGMLAGHDYVNGKLPWGNFGVKTAVNEFADNYKLPFYITCELEWRSWYLRKPNE